MCNQGGLGKEGGKHDVCLSGQEPKEHHSQSQARVETMCAHAGLGKV